MPLIEFIQPLLDGSEDAGEYLLKAQTGMIAWNYSVIIDMKLSFHDQLNEMLKSELSFDANAKETFEMLTKRKKEIFFQYKQFFFSVNIIRNPDMTIKLVVETTQTDILENI